MKTIRWGIIGCGDVTEKKSGPAFSKATNSALVAVMRRDAAKAADYARRHAVPRWYDDADKLINDPEVDAVYIATPPASHMEYTVRAAEAGKPVYVEKPMALDPDQCQLMIDTCREKNVPLFVAYYRRALPRFLKIRDLIEEGSIGTVHSVNVRYYSPPQPQDLEPTKGWRVNPQVSGGGYFIDMASHTLDFLDFLFGPIREFSGRAVNQGGLYQAEDNVSMLFSFDNNITGIGSWLFTAGEELDTAEIVGTEGTIRFSSFMNNPLQLQRKGKTEEFDIPHPEHIQQSLIQSIVDELLGIGSCPSTGESAQRTTIVTDTVLKEYYRSNRLLDR